MGQETNKLELSKRVKVIQNNINLGTFPSINHLVRESMEELGVKLDKACVSKCCNNIRPLHRGFNFEFVN